MAVLYSEFDQIPTIMANLDLNAQSRQDLLFEDSQVRIWRVTVPPGASSDAYAAADTQDHVFCVLEGGRALVTGEAMSAWSLELKRGQVTFVPAGVQPSRAYANLGEADLTFLRVELKQ